MTRLEEMAQVAQVPAYKMRYAIERLIEIGNGSAAVNGFLAGILTEHDLETTEPPRPSRP